jgi:hypothetical protein
MAPAAMCPIRPLFAKRIALSIGQMFHVLRHAITPVPESARFAFKIIGD